MMIMTMTITMTMTKEAINDDGDDDSDDVDVVNGEKKQGLPPIIAARCLSLALALALALARLLACSRLLLPQDDARQPRHARVPHNLPRTRFERASEVEGGGWREGKDWGWGG